MKRADGGKEESKGADGGNEREDEVWAEFGKEERRGFGEQERKGGREQSRDLWGMT